MNSEEHVNIAVKPKEHFERVFLAISTAICLFAFQNCSSTSMVNKSTNDQVQKISNLRVDDKTSAR